MIRLPVILGNRGAFHPDVAGLYHYVHSRATGHVDDGVADALACRPTSPAWFWWNDTPAPIAEGDTVATLVKRWSEARAACQQGSIALLLVRLCEMPGSAG